MYRIFQILFLSLIFISCNKIILKKEVIERLPFEKIEKGIYEINLYNLEYPEKLLEKEDFFHKFNILIQKLLIAEKKMSLLISEDFYKDYENLKKGNLLNGEEIFYKIASDLNQEEIEEIKRFTGISEIEIYKDTVQENLNLQICFILKVIKQEEKFDKEKLYTELDKEEYVDILKEQRKKMFSLLSKLKIDYIINIEDTYEKVKEEDNKKYWLNKEINLGDKGYFTSKIEKYTTYIYLNSVKNEEIESLLKEDLILKNKLVILDNEIYKGYHYINDDYLFFINGEKKLNYFEGYEVYIKLKNADFQEILQSNEEYILSDFVGGK